MTAIAQPAQPDVPTRLLAGVSVPDTPLISRAIDFARERSEPYLFNHVMRSWLFAALIAQRNQTTHDGEVLAVTTILHDLGLAEAFNGPLRFEVEGANAARTFARNEGMDDRRAQLSGTELPSTRRLRSAFTRKQRLRWQRWASVWIGVVGVTRR